MLFFKKFGYLVFGIFAVADITLIAVDEESFRFLTKPFLLPVLLLIILVQSAGQKHPIAKKLVFIALVAGTIGDILLLKSGINPNYFTFGLTAFLVMQLFYTLYFFRMQGIKKEFVVINIFIALLITGFSFVLVGSLWNYFGKLQMARGALRLRNFINAFCGNQCLSFKTCAKTGIAIFYSRCGIFVGFRLNTGSK